MSTGAAASTGAFIEGMTIADHFVIRRKLGGGGMGEVYLAENLNVENKKYAIKILRREYSNNPRFVAMLKDEATKQAKLDHDNVVGMYDFFPWAGHYCLLQAFVKGKTLAQMIAEQPQGLAIDQALTLMTGILSGLNYAFLEAGILHCDVKPANVIVDGDGRPRVIDFGISRDIGPNARLNGLGGAGTAEYMSPEQILPPYDIDHRTDVFSAGVMFFEMLCGRLPFQSEPGANSLTLPQLTQDAPDVRQFRPEVPEAIARIVATALQRDVTRRFQACADFRHAIEEHRRRERWRRTWLPAIAVMLVLGVAGTAGLYYWRKHVDDEVRRQAQLNEMERLAQIERAKGTARDALHNAAVSLNLLCRESFEYAAKQVGLQKAREAGFDDIAKKFEVRLSDMQGNMDRQAASYAEAMKVLKQVDPALGAQVLAAQADADPLLRPVLDSIRADDAALRAGRSVATRAELLRRCPVHGGGGRP